VNRPEAGRLLMRYRDGELSPDERRQLMDVILSDQNLYNAFAEELILAEMLEDAGFRAKVNAAVQPVPGVRGRLAMFFRDLNAGWRRAGVLAAVALVLGSSVVLYRAKHHEEDVVARGGVPAKQSVPRQPETPANPAPVNPATQEPAVKGESRFETDAAALATLLLVPSERGLGEGKNVLQLRNQRTVQLLINLGEDSRAYYRAVLASADMRFSRNFDNLRPHRDRGGARQLALKFPSSLLRAGDYTVTIYGLTSAGTREIAGGYSLSVEQEK
jgi:hypothetical protein